MRDTTQPKVASRLGSGNDNVVALTHTNTHVSRSIGNDGYEIVCDNFQSVVVDSEAEMGVGSAVNKTDTIPGTSDEVGLEPRADHRSIGVGPSVRAIDEAVVGSRRPSRGSCQRKDVGCLVGPVVQEDVAEIHVVVGRSRTVDENASKNAVPSLDRKVGVIPAGSVLNSAPLVGLSIAGSDRALGDRRHAVHLLEESQC